MPRADEIREATLQGAQQGLVAFAIVGACSTLGVLAANRVWPRFRNHLGVSGKAALAFSPAMFAFFLRSERVVVHRAQKR